MTNPSSRWRHSAAGRRRLTVAGLVGALGAGLVGLVSTPPALAQPNWSPAVSLVRCASAVAPQVVFPKADPFHASGPGAILWAGTPADCNPAHAATGPGVGIATFQPDHTLGPPASLPASRPPRLSALSAATATGDGRIVLAGSIGPSAGGPAGLSQGVAGGPFAPAGRLGGPTSPIAVTSSYRGDVGIASVDAAGRIELRLEAHGTPRIGRAVVLSSGAAPVTALAANIDYRGDAIVAWAARGSIYVRARAATGVLLPAQRVAGSPPSVRLGVVISDDNRAIVAWESDKPAAGGQPTAPAPNSTPTRPRPRTTTTTTTSTYLAISLPGVHFGRPRLLDRFVDPPGVSPAPTGVQLVRLAHEGVVVGWTGLENGHLVVRSSPVSLNSVRPTTTVSDPDADAMLTGLATGPRDEVIALWTAAPRVAGRPDPSQERVLAARGASEPSGMTKFDAPQVIAGPGPVATPEVAIDPVTDVAVAVWRNRGRNPGIDYAVRGTTSAAGVAGRPVDGGQTARGGNGWEVVVGIVVGALGLVGAVLAGVRRRIRRSAERRRRSPLWMPTIAGPILRSRFASGYGRFRPTVDARRRTWPD